MSEPGERVVLSLTRVSRIVDEMVTVGLVERTPNPEDGRTTDGPCRSELRRTAPAYLSGIEDHCQSLLNVRQRIVLPTALQRVAEHHHRERDTTH